MIIVHHLETSRSHRVLWLLEELAIPYELKTYKRDSVTLLAPPELQKIHPLGKSPVLEDGGNIVAESAAILEYLLDRYDVDQKLRPQSSKETNKEPDKEFLRYRYWLHYAESSLMPLLVLTLVFQKITQPPMPFVLRPFAKIISLGFSKAYIAPQIKRHIDFMESEIKNSEFFVGHNFSAADIQMSYPLLALDSRYGLKNRLKAMVEKYKSRPAYQRAIARGGPVMIEL